LVAFERHRVFRAGTTIDVAKEKMPLSKFLLHLPRLFVRDRATPTTKCADQEKNETFLGHDEKLSIEGVGAPSPCF